MLKRFLNRIYAWSQTQAGDLVIGLALLITAGIALYGTLWLSYFLGY